MDDFDQSKEDTTPGRPAPNTAFRRAMNDVAEHCRQLMARLGNQDVCTTEDIIRNAVTLWIVGREACRRIVESNREGSPYAQAARQLLEDMYVRLLVTIEDTRKLIVDLQAQAAHPNNSCPNHDTAAHRMRRRPAREALASWRRAG